MRKPVKAKAISGSDLFSEIQNRIKKAEKDAVRFKENGGICLKCGKNHGDVKSQINPFQCKECNKEAEEALKILRGSPGFSEFRF